VIEFNFLEILALFAIALATSWTFTGIMRKVAIKLDITDRPDTERKLQKEPIPYLGGLGIMISLLLLVSIGVLTLNISSEFREDIYFLFVPALILGLVGLWDDLKNLSPQFRLMVQVLMGLAGSLTITFGSTTGSISGNATLDLLISIFWIVGITNAINFFDNIDGGAAIACFISSFGFCAYGFLTGQPYIGVFGLLLMGVLAGFFIWNRRPARIYMGDSGALFLGILLATITIRIDPSVDSKISSLVVPILFLALPILDTSVVVWTRIRNRRSPIRGGLDHLSHRLASKGLPHRFILLQFSVISLIFQIPVFVMVFVPTFIQVAMAFSGITLLLLLFNHFRKITVFYENK
jgi:UDP-GlcNAc:undecaprenyl-phosphate GlcNAc-1-phosphate transferase